MLEPSTIPVAPGSVGTDKIFAVANVSGPTRTIGWEQKKPPESLLRDEMRAVAVTRDRASFARLFDYFAPRLKAYVRRAGTDEQTAEELAQEAMIQVWNKAASFDPSRAAVSTWIFTIVRNKRIDRLRRRSSQPYEDVDGLEIASDEPSGEDEVAASQLSERVADAMTELPEEQRQVIDLAYIQDLSQSEIAERLQLPLGTVKSRMRLAYARLKSSLVDLQ